MPFCNLDGVRSCTHVCNQDGLGSWPAAWLQSSRDSSKRLSPQPWHQSVLVRVLSTAGRTGECSGGLLAQPRHQLVPTRAVVTTARGPGDTGQQEGEEARLAATAERLTLEAARLLGMGQLEHAEYLLADGECLSALPVARRSLCFTIATSDAHA